MSGAPEARAPLRIGVVGAGRSRNGLGPFLAQAFEREGAIVTGVAGRDEARAEANALELAGRLGHPVAPYADERALSRSGIDVLVIASPTNAHAVGLDAALDAGLACFCEKPIVDLPHVDAAIGTLARFADAGILVTENSQWPYVLTVVDEIHGTVRAGKHRRLEVGLSPIDADPLLMAKESLPHLLSMAWALAALEPGQELALESARGVGVRDGAMAIEATFVGTHGRIDTCLHLAQCVEQPRPAWVAVDGRRIDRKIGPGYSISFEGGGREIPVEDPLFSLVGQFVRDCRVAPSAARDRRRAEAARAVAARLRLWRDALQRLFG